MKIAYVTPYKIDDSGVASGTVVSVKKALEEAGNEVLTVDNLSVPKCYSFILKALKRLFHKEVNVLREPFVLKKITKEMERRLGELDFDIVFSQTSILCTYYKGEKPIVFYTDATFGGMINYYWDTDIWFGFAVRHGNETESLALKNCTKAIFASKWAVESAIKFHDASSSKCIAINRGANIYHNYKFQEIKKYVEKRYIITKRGEIRCLFVGRDWERKGGWLALEIVKKLCGRGIISKMVIVGCNPIISDDDKRYVEIIGFLNKEIREENQKLQMLFLTSDFYLQPSKQECQGIAYAEASAFGLPVIATNTGGVSDIVTPSNGILMSSEANISDYADTIQKFVAEPDEYRALALCSFEFYMNTLNWKSVGQRLSGVLQQVMENRDE